MSIYLLRTHHNQYTCRQKQNNENEGKKTDVHVKRACTVHWASRVLAEVRSMGAKMVAVNIEDNDKLRCACSSQRN